MTGFVSIATFILLVTYYENYFFIFLIVLKIRIPPLIFSLHSHVFQTMSRSILIDKCLCLIRCACAHVCLYVGTTSLHDKQYGKRFDPLQLSNIYRELVGFVRMCVMSSVTLIVLIFVTLSMTKLLKTNTSDARLQASHVKLSFCTTLHGDVRDHYEH